ncbi:MAG TPA: hypothetical protein VFV67_07300 [Actinophytocola sp.]|uniref:hypothetical protein n=1 Tax=Actinophytocola sp. TaxID=1872138 RepID=UPI002DBBE316|nr:hypothetical protein [Actinophytocola sp.]HEU5470442.1 hypothetical protein [Actinophytocola sp.]
MTWGRLGAGVAVLALTGAVLAGDTESVTLSTGPMMERAQEWFRLAPEYSQDACFRADGGYQGTDWSAVLGGCRWPYYRTDCSGFVSMVWGLPFSYATPRAGLDSDLTDVSTVITKDELRTGDALLAWGRHVRLFVRWTDAARTRYLAFDFGATPVKHQVYVWAGAGEYDYVPIRYRAPV